MATTSFRLPDLGEGVTESEVVRWLIEPGQAVAEDDPMVEVMTDKATVEIPSPASGTIERICVDAGTVVPVGTVLVEIATTGDSSVRDAAPVTVAREVAAPAGGKEQSSTSEGAVSGERVRATPLVRKLASELGVDLGAITGSGRDGRITDADVRAAAGSGATATAGESVQSAGLPEPVEVTAVRGVRRGIAEHLSGAQQVPTVTVVEQCDVTALNAAREASALSYVTYLVRAVAKAVQEVPDVNATYHPEGGGTIRRYATMNAGVAVQTDAGLLVPVVRDAHAMSAADIDAQVAALAEGARSGTLDPQQLRGGTITVTSAGRFGGLFTTPLLNTPQVAIVGLHRAFDQPVVRDGEIVIRTMANVSISFDHRAIDGITASRFVLALAAALEAPDELL